MPGPQSRRSSAQNLASTITRRAQYGPGAYRVVRSSSPIEEVPGWITPPAQTVTGLLGSFKVDSRGDVHTEATFATSCAEAWAEFNVTSPGSTIASGMLLGAGGTFAGVGAGALAAVVGEGIVYVGADELRTDGFNNFTYPTGAILHPDDVSTLISAQVVGAIVCDATDSTTAVASVRQVAEADWDFIAGADFQDPTLIAAAPVVVPAVAGVANTLYPFAFDIDWDSNDQAAYVTVLDTWVNLPWDPHNQRSATLTDQAGVAVTPEWVATVAIPRYRIP